MIRNNTLKSESITPCDSLKPTTPTTALDHTNDPLTTTTSTSVVFTMEKVTFVSFNDNRLTISIKSSKKGAVVQQPRVSLLVEVIIIINNCVPAANTLGRALRACILTRTASKRKASQFSLLVFHSWRRRNQFSHCNEYYRTTAIACWQLLHCILY